MNARQRRVERRRLDRLFSTVDLDHRDGDTFRLSRSVERICAQGERRAHAAKVRCQACHGTGFELDDRDSTTDGTGYFPPPAEPCEVCDGTGRARPSVLP